MAGENAADILNRLGDRWKGIIERAANLDPLKTEGESKDTFRVKSLQPLGQSYEQAERLRKQLLKEYKDKKIEDVFSGREVGIEGAACYQIQSHSPLDLNVVNRDTVKERLLSNLKLLYGIGNITEEKLKGLGYATIPDLTGHPKYGHEAQRFLGVVGNGNINELGDWIRRWFSGSHPLAFFCSSFHDTGDMVILDIETMGLSPDTPIILLGAAYIDGPNIIVKQYLVRNIEEEVAVLKMFLSHVNLNSFLVTFNGKSFDLPYIKARMAYYGVRAQLDLPHYDMLYFSRNAWRDRVPDCRLTTLEEYLFGVTREDDVPSELVPSFYETYLKSKNIGPLVPIIEHNRQDLITLVRIFSLLHEEWK